MDKFYKLDQNLTARKDLSSTAKLIFAIIKDHIGNHDNTWIGILLLTKKAGCCRSTVLESISRLESLSLLVVERRENGMSNLYSLPKSSMETILVGKSDQSGNQTTGGRKTRP